MLTKTQILEALRVWINQRPGLEFGNYGDWSAYRSELRSITKDRRDALTLLTSVSLRDSITAKDLLEAFPHAFSGRLSITSRFLVNGKPFKTLAEAQERANNYLPAIVEIREVPALDYCTGQYWPTEYRKAACAVLASVLWNQAREDMPKPNGKITRTHGPFTTEHDNINGKTPGDWLRDHFRKEFGRSIQTGWFN
jgi:hypothetical protein